MTIVRHIDGTNRVRAEIDKAWDAIHRALTDGTLEPGAFPLGRAILGGRQLHRGDDYIVALVTKLEVPAVAGALATTPRPARLRLLRRRRSRLHRGVLPRGRRPLRPRRGRRVRGDLHGGSVASIGCEVPGSHSSSPRVRARALLSNARSIPSSSAIFRRDPAIRAIATTGPRLAGCATRSESRTTRSVTSAAAPRLCAIPRKRLSAPRLVGRSTSPARSYLSPSQPNPYSAHDRSRQSGSLRSRLEGRAPR
jgi:hypothetical protein